MIRSTSKYRRFATLVLAALALFLALFLSSSARALIMVGRGNAPVEDHNWPFGALEVANLKTRVGWWEGPPFGGGQWQFLYRGDAAALQEALDRFAKIRAPELRLVIHEGPHENQFLKDDRDPKGGGGRHQRRLDLHHLGPAQLELALQ